MSSGSGCAVRGTAHLFMVAGGLPHLRAEPLVAPLHPKAMRWSSARALRPLAGGRHGWCVRPGAAVSVAVDGCKL